VKGVDGTVGWSVKAERMSEVGRLGEILDFHAKI
jgi:hypothetical protein